MEKKDVFVSAIKGFMNGIASLVSGLSISSVLLSTNSYDNFVKGISNPKKESKAFRYVTIPLIIGIILGLIAGFHLIDLFWTKYKLQTIILFVGLLLGGIKVIYVKHNIKLNKCNICIPIVIIILTVLLIYSLKDSTFVIKNNMINTIVLAIITGLSCLIPGISVYSVRLKHGYKTVLNAISNLTNLNSLLTIVTFILVLVVVIIVFSKIIKHLIDKNRNITYIVLCSLILSNVILLVIQIGKIQINFISIITSLLAFIWGFIFANNVERE